ncbi:Protein-L-isoaspartate O-methyltransferase [Thioalkalivibrio nitratireducens DSM 14787]|uniref:Protein-L-isoaspartate O-methyltransferase n=1 Tax=Thioalkalivibrio nitratireducens (strain DSM 14787 / UNIQEM 213 / ALEN2) TaxID=1255043 RepID=L0DVK5_THIND|nr:Protein-L-isoaspartate O-methyltransferase [Thioalkalivibrio nitratireducens DSM 14787]
MVSSRKQRIDTLVAEVEREFQETSGSTGISAPDARLVEALRRVPRDAFVPDDSARFAWENRALSIGHGQTISQPFVVALMTQLLELTPESRVLEIGTGSGYQAALLAELAQEVFSIEVVPELARSAAENLQRQGYRNVRVRAGDGRRGWPEAAPFDAVIVTAGAESIPPALVEQLKPGGHLVIPVDSHWLGQDLVLVTRGADGTLHRRAVLSVIFVPLVGGEGGTVDPWS